MKELGEIVLQKRFLSKVHFNKRAPFFDKKDRWRLNPPNLKLHFIKFHLIKKNNLFQKGQF